MATEAGVAAASTAAVGFGLFNYNRAETQWICPWIGGVVTSFIVWWEILKKNLYNI